MQIIRKFIIKTLNETRFSAITNPKSLTFDNFLTILKQVWINAKKYIARKNTPRDSAIAVNEVVKSIRAMVYQTLRLPHEFSVDKLVSDFHSFDKDLQDMIIVNFENYRDANFPRKNIQDFFDDVRKIEDILTTFKIGESVYFVMRFNKAIHHDVGRLSKFVTDITHLKNLPLNKTVTGKFKLRSPHADTKFRIMVIPEKSLTEDFFKTTNHYYYLIFRHIVDEKDKFTFFAGHHTVDVDYDYIDVESIMIYDPDFESETEDTQDENY